MAGPGRPKKQGVIIPASGVQAIRVRFLYSALVNNSPALRLLATNVRDGRMTVSKWAASATGVDLSRTWVENWANESLSAWSIGTCPPPVVNNSRIEKWFWLDEQLGVADISKFSCTISVSLLSRLEYEWIIGAVRSASKIEDDKARVKARVTVDAHAELDRELARFFEESAYGTIPSDLERKLECAALYLLCGRSRKDLAAHVNQAEQTMYDWITEATGLLGLPMKRRGHQSNPKFAKMPSI